MLELIKPKHYLIRIAGLLDQVPDKNFLHYCSKFEAGGYERDIDPTDSFSRQMLQDYLYPDFRKIMFGDATDQRHVRFRTTQKKTFQLTVPANEHTLTYTVTVSKCELYLFRGHLGLFSLTIELDPGMVLKEISDVLNRIRNFSAKNTDNTEWHHWISANYLLGIPLRSTPEKRVEVDEYSGSKFKLFTAYDLEIEDAERTGLLYDMGTVSPILSANGATPFSPDPEYYQQMMANQRVAAFRNWEAICLFDGFCAIGTNFLLDNKGELKKDWEITYFRLYLFRLFFKYNLYRYNTLVSQAEDEKTIQYRDQFEDFLNHYHISHISFNFLPNLLFDKMGKALELNEEVDIFRDRIRNLSTVIQEQKQARTNLLLQAVTVISGLGFLVDINSYIHQIQEYTHLTTGQIFSISGLILLLAAFGIYFYLKPEMLRKWFDRK